MRCKFLDPEFSKPILFGNTLFSFKYELIENPLRIAVLFLGATPMETGPLVGGWGLEGFSGS